MFIVLCLNIYMASYLRIDIRLLRAINGAQNNTSNCQIEMRPIIIFFSNIVLCGLNAGNAYVD